MKCYRCGYLIQGKALFCPNCGIKLSEGQAGSRIRSPEPFAEMEETERGGCGLSLAVLGIAVIVMLAILGLGVAAYYYGIQDRAAREQAAAQDHYVKGVAHLERDEYELAIAELEVALQLKPNDPQALEALTRARQQLEARPTATPVLEIETKAAYLEELHAAYAAEDWQRVYDYADRLLALDPSYKRGEVDMILFEAFYRTGLQFVEQDRMKEAIRLFDRALALQPDNVQVARAKHLATLHITAMGYWGADWAKTVETLRELYRLAPEYKNVRDDLRRALISYGDVLSQSAKPCEAADQYTQALQFGGDTDLQAKYAQAQTQCLQGPVPPTSGMQTPGVPVLQRPSGIFVGRVVEQTGISDTKMFIRGKVLDKNGRGVVGVQVKIQAWDWSALAITDGNGQFAFDGLANPVTYRLSLVTLPSQPVDAPGQWGKITWVNFEQVP